MGDWVGEFVCEGEEDVPFEGGEGGEGAAEADCEADVEGDCLFGFEVVSTGLGVAAGVGGLVIGGGGSGWGAPFFAEELAVFGEEAHYQGAAEIGPEVAEGDWGAGVEGDPLGT